MGKKPLPEAISIRQTSEILGVSCMTIRRWIILGYIKAYRVGPRLIRIPRSEISRMRSVRLGFQVEEDQPRYPRV